MPNVVNFANFLLKPVKKKCIAFVFKGISSFIGYMLCRYVLQQSCIGIYIPYHHSTYIPNTNTYKHTFHKYHPPNSTYTHSHYKLCLKIYISIIDFNIEYKILLTTLFRFFFYITNAHA